MEMNGQGRNRQQLRRAIGLAQTQYAPRLLAPDVPTRGSYAYTAPDQPLFEEESSGRDRHGGADQVLWRPHPLHPV